MLLRDEKGTKCLGRVRVGFRPIRFDILAKLEGETLEWIFMFSLRLSRAENGSIGF